MANAGTTGISAFFDIETDGSTLIVRMDGGDHGLMGRGMTDALSDLLDRLDRDPAIRAVVFTGKHPRRFIAHADVRWLQEGGKSIPQVGGRVAAAIAHAAKIARAVPPLGLAASVTPLEGGMQLNKLHDTFLRMNRSPVIFAAAINGSALGLGSEFALANDLRFMADGDFFIGQPEVLLGINPGGGGTQRLPRLIGEHRAMLMMLEGCPVSPARALEIGYVDQVVPPETLLEQTIAAASYLASRPPVAIAAIKRSVYFGASMPLDQGLLLENAEFIMASPGDEAQALMVEYLARIDRDGDLPFYDPATLAHTLKHGRLAVPGRGAAA